MIVSVLVAFAPRGLAQAPPQIQLEQALQGLDNPVYVTHAGDDRLFAVEQPGRIQVAQAGAIRDAPFLDITDRVRWGHERGLLGLAFHPDYRKNGRFFVHYTRQPDGAVVIAEYAVSADPNVAKASERVLFTVPHGHPAHNGGMLAFGPDGYLYIAIGDGWGFQVAQRTIDLRGKILRIDVGEGGADTKGYRIPADNPFVGGGGRPEVFALGFRNPWRFSFDRQTGQLWAGDVGDDAWEEIDLVRRAGNYGWPTMEGTHCFRPRRGCEAGGFEPPVAEYSHGDGRCAVIGGYVYRGDRASSLAGTYLFGDFCSGEIFGLIESRPHVLLSTGLGIASFGEDRAGDVYVVSVTGTVHRIVERPEERR